MNVFDIRQFADINDLAATIGTQNEKYISIGRIPHPEIVQRNQGPIAYKQAELVEFLGILAAELPYAELAAAYLDTANDMADTEARLAEVDDAPDTRKIAVRALASLMIDEFGASEEVAELRVMTRTTEINSLNRLALKQRKAQLSKALASLSSVWEVAGQAWPLPIAHKVPQNEPDTDPANVKKYTGKLQEPGVGGLVTADDFSINNRSRRHPDTTCRSEHRERQVDQPDASVLIATHLATHYGREITVDELLEVLYAHCSIENIGRNALRSRVTTLLGPKIQGERIAEMLEEKGYKLQYGWRKIMQRRPNGELKQLKRVRVYRATPIVDDKLNSGEFFSEELPVDYYNPPPNYDRTPFVESQNSALTKV